MKYSKKYMNLEKGLKTEWIITNGLGGYAASSIIGANTRKYHGLLVAPLTPPARRFLVLSKLDESIEIVNKKYNIYTNIGKDYVTDGYKYQKYFEKSEIPVYYYEIEDKKGHIYIDNIGKVTKGEYPLLLQYDKKWGYGIYGDNVIAINGCGPTSLAMVVAGLTGKNDTTPYDIAKYSYEKGYYTEEWGTKWDLMSIGIEPFGIIGKKIVLSKQNLYNELNNGHPLIASMRPGDFTTVGHFIVLTGIKDDKIIVNDPNSRERSAKLWEYDVIAPQIKGLWTYSLAS